MSWLREGVREQQGVTGFGTTCQHHGGFIRARATCVSPRWARMLLWKRWMLVMDTVGWDTKVTAVFSGARQKTALTLRLCLQNTSNENGMCPHRCLLQHVSQLELPHLANKNIGYPVKLEFYINNTQNFRINISHTILEIYYKFLFIWNSNLTGNPVFYLTTVRTPLPLSASSKVGRNKFTSVQ